MFARTWVTLDQVTSLQCRVADLACRASDTKSRLARLKPPMLGCRTVASGLRHQQSPVL